MPLCLPSVQYNLTNMAADVAGWGDHAMNETRGLGQNSNLMQVELEILPTDLYNIREEDVEYEGYNSSTMFSVGDLHYINRKTSGIKSTWKGESGGRIYKIDMHKKKT